MSDWVIAMLMVAAGSALMIWQFGLGDFLTAVVFMVLLFAALGMAAIAGWGLGQKL